MTRVREAERGTLGIAVLVRDGLPIADSHIVPLPTLRRDHVRRAAVVVDLAVDGVDISVIGTHMSHLHMGSSRHYRQLRDDLEGQARPTAVLSGDMNLWGPPVRYFLRGWHRAVKGASWPTWHPHSQIDHILVRGSISIVSGEVRPDAGLDHSTGPCCPQLGGVAGVTGGVGAGAAAGGAAGERAATASPTESNQWSGPIRFASPTLRKVVTVNSVLARAMPKVMWLAARSSSTSVRARQPVKSMSVMPMVSSTTTWSGPTARGAGQALTSAVEVHRWRTRAGGRPTGTNTQHPWLLHRAGVER